MSINYAKSIKFQLGRKWAFQIELNNKKQSIENPANLPEVRAIEDFWSILKGKVYENNWNAENLAQLRNKIVLGLRKMDPNLEYKLIASTSSRLNKIRMHGLIEKSY
jgi:hypothetical protein